MSQVRNGLRIAAQAIIGIVIAGLFFVGVAYAFFPTAHSTIVGWAFLVISSTVLIATMDRWVKALPGILAYAVLMGIVAIYTGHFFYQPALPDSRVKAVILTLFFAASTRLSLSLRGRKLNAVDRIAVLGFVFSIALGAGYDSARSTATGRMPSSEPIEYIATGVALGCLSIAWVYDRIQRHRHHKLSS